MTATTCHHTSNVVDAAIEALQDQLAGTLILPGDDRYNECRSLWNGMIDKRPAMIVQPAGVSDVLLAVNIAKHHGLRLSIKGGGHNVAGHASVDYGMMIDMSSMKSVHVDPARRTARVEAGATWGDFDRETSVFGLATTAGVISSTGVAGLTLGGGIGWLVGKHGLAVDNLLSVEMVTAEGQWLVASSSENPDLFWALRGGGGNFGVVTAFEFQLHPVDEVLAGYFVWPASDTQELLAFFREFTETNPEEMTCYFQIATDPDSGMRIAIIIVFYPEVSDTAYALIDQVRSFRPPLMESVEPIRYRHWQSAFDQEFPSGVRYYWKGALLHDLNSGAIQAVIDHAVEPPLPGCVVAIEHYRGAMNRVAPDATAFANRDAHYQIVIIGGWNDEADDDTGIAWVRTLYAAASQHGLQASFLNFNSSEGAEHDAMVRAGYRQNYERLSAIKRQYDPENFFNQNNNIKP